MSVRSIDDTKYDTLCFDCQSDVGLERPQFHAMVAFNGNFTEQTCDRCSDRILP